MIFKKKKKHLHKRKEKQKKGAGILVKYRISWKERQEIYNTNQRELNSLQL